MFHVYGMAKTARDILDSSSQNSLAAPLTAISSLRNYMHDCTHLRYQFVGRNLSFITGEHSPGETETVAVASLSDSSPPPLTENYNREHLPPGPNPKQVYSTQDELN